MLIRSHRLGSMLPPLTPTGWQMDGKSLINSSMPLPPRDHWWDNGIKIHSIWSETEVDASPWPHQLRQVDFTLHMSATPTGDRIRERWRDHVNRIRVRCAKADASLRPLQPWQAYSAIHSLMQSPPKDWCRYWGIRIRRPSPHQIFSLQGRRTPRSTQTPPPPET